MHRSLTALALFAAAISTSAHATTTISFSANSAADGTNGNIAVYSNGGLTVQASGWSFNGSSIETAWLGQYFNGLGVTNNSEGSGTLSNSSAIDNVGGIDFVLLVFDQAVNIQSAVLTPYAVSGSPADNDATIGYANVAGAFTAPNPTPMPLSSPAWTSLLNNLHNDPGNTSAPFATLISPPSSVGNVWLIAADASGLDYSADGFRLTSVSVNTASVPEPASWLTMLLGFAAMGLALRRRRATRPLRQFG